MPQSAVLGSSSENLADSTRPQNKIALVLQAKCRQLLSRHQHSSPRNGLDLSQSPISGQFYANTDAKRHTMRSIRCQWALQYRGILHHRGMCSEFDARHLGDGSSPPFSKKDCRNIRQSLCEVSATIVLTASPQTPNLHSQELPTHRSLLCSHDSRS